jgi:hypothetical protein
MQGLVDRLRFITAPVSLKAVKIGINLIEIGI